MKPFKISEALAGKPVVTRNGRPATQITYFETNGYYPVAAVVDGELCLFTRFGRYASNVVDSPKDLFMDTVKKTYFMNMYEHNFKPSSDGRPGFYTVTSGTVLHPTEEAAQRGRKNSERNGLKFVTVVSFVVEE